MGFDFCAGLAGIVIVSLGVAAAVLSWRERRDSKNGNGIEHLKRLIEK